ncbi:MAG: helix-turn-helix transcriptional regulator [Phycisphaeraceae bacterium]|nr:helix-turn-helix transcriptional regulator [Phycisphaeraceae bacterium]
MTETNTINWPDLDLWYLVDGYGEVQTPQGIHPLQPGTCLIMRGGQPYNFHRTSPQPFSHYFVHFSFLDDQGQVISPNLPPHMPLYRTMHEISPLATLLDRALEVFRGPAELRHTVDVWLYAAVLEINREDQHAHRQPSESRWNYDHDVETLCKEILDNPAKHLSMNELGLKLHCSRAHVYRRFKQHTGRSPQQFAIDTRMQAAHFLLLDSNLPISQIALRLGYADIYFFSRQFKQHHGISPAAFRKSPDAARHRHNRSARS